MDAGDAHTCALTFSGAAFCWGSNAFGQLGIDSLTRASWPVAVRGGFTYASISAGGASTCANTAAGIRCWGKIAVQPGDPGGVKVDPTLVAADGRFFGVSVGDANACAQFPGPVGVIARCWGDNRNGQVGVPATMIPAAPTVTAAFDVPVSRIAAQRDYVCAEVGSGIVECLGSNQDGQLGDGSMNSSSIARRVDTRTALHGVATGAGFACALDAAGRALCWGGGFGPSPRALPAAEPPSGIDTYRAIAVGARHACAIGTDNHIYCLGSNSFGQLGVGDQRPDLASGAAIPVRALDPR